MKAVVTMLVTGKFSAQIDVDETQQGTPDMDDLKAKALSAFCDADFGPLYDIDMEYKHCKTDTESFITCRRKAPSFRHGDIRRRQIKR